jgi:hypothetical protein
MLFTWQPGAPAELREKWHSGVHFAQDVEDIVADSPLLLGPENLGKNLTYPDAVSCRVGA